MYGYGNSMFLATHGILARSASGGGVDPDAQAFITAASITDPTQQSAINTLVLDLKGYNIWTKFKAIYPIVGGVASSHAVNLKTPGTFNLTFTNSWTHSSTGMTPDGVSAFANTSLVPSTNLSLNSTHISGYLRTNLTFAGPIISTEDAGTYNNGLYIWPKQSSNQYSVRINDNGGTGVSTAPADIRGLHIATRTAVNVKKYRLNNTPIFNSVEASTGLNTSSIYLGASRNNANYNGNQLAFASIGDGLTDTDATNFYTAVQAFQTTLGRQVGVPIVSDADAQAFLNAAVIEDVTQANAINNLVIGMKADGIWTKMKAIYPIVGGSAATHKWNLKDPRDLDAAYRLTFATGWTHSSTGMTPLNAYADTNFNVNTYQNNNHISLYIRTNINESSVDMGVFSTAGGGTFFDIESRFSNAAYFGNHVANTYITFTNSDSRGFYINNRTSSTLNNVFLNNTKKATLTNATTSSFNLNMWIGARNTAGSGSLYSTKECAFASIGDGLTDTDATNLYNRVNTFQVTLNRNV